MAPLIRAIALSQILLQVSYAGLSHAEDSHHSASLRWSELTPSKELIYHSCYERFKCARLLVPLDWQATEAVQYNSTIALAIIKLPANVSITDPTYGGAIIINPGGPGGSGVTFLLSQGSFLQDVVSSSDIKTFDMISFDPRGVRYSEPHTNCFSDPVQRDLWNIKSSDEGLLDTGNQTVALQWARAKAFGALCANAGVGKYIGTTSVARDLLKIVEKIEEDHEKEILGLGAGMGGENIGCQVPFLAKEHSMLQYYGFSYGTFLGNTFASMFPDRVKRMVLDGVVDAPGCITQASSTGVEDTDKVMDAFYSSCFDAGPRCALYDEAGPDAIARSLNAFLRRIRHYPLVAEDNSGAVPPGVITYSDLKRIIFDFLYNPINTFPALAILFDQLQREDYSQMLRIINFQTFVHCPSDKNNTSMYLKINNEAFQAVNCGDADDISNRTRSDFEEHLAYFESQSSMGGAIWATLRLACTGWQTRPNWRYTGPFGGNTSKPILWIGNTADPVTPLQNAHNMAKRFPRSRVLQQDSVGHCSLYSAPSNCTVDAIRRYFSSGLLPEPGTVCPADRKPFDGGPPIYNQQYDKLDGESSFTSDVANILRQRKFILHV